MLLFPRTLPRAVVRKKEQPEEKKEHILTGEHEHAIFILYRSARDVYFSIQSLKIRFVSTNTRGLRLGAKARLAVKRNKTSNIRIYEYDIIISLLHVQLTVIKLQVRLG